VPGNSQAISLLGSFYTAKTLKGKGQVKRTGQIYSATNEIKNLSVNSFSRGEMNTGFFNIDENGVFSL
jgi:hypothetical protein